MITVDQSGGRGRGVFAKRRFVKGQLIVRAPVIVLTTWQYSHLAKTFLINYCFMWGDEMAIALGPFLLCNHSYSPNVAYVRKLDDGVMEMVALRDIAEGEEIVMNYNGDPEDRSPVWFEVVDPPSAVTDTTPALRAPSVRIDTTEPAGGVWSP